MNIAETTVHGWKYHLSGSNLSITSEQNPQLHLELSAEAAFSLLNYLYQYRDDLLQEIRKHDDQQTSRMRE